MKLSEAAVPFRITCPSRIESRSGAGDDPLDVHRLGVPSIRGGARLARRGPRRASRPRVRPRRWMKDDDVPDRRRGVEVGVPIDEDRVPRAQGRNHAPGPDRLQQRGTDVIARGRLEDLPTAALPDRDAGRERLNAVEGELNRYPRASSINRAPLLLKARQREQSESAGPLRASSRGVSSDRVRPAHPGSRYQDRGGGRTGAARCAPRAGRGIANAGLASQ